MITFFLLALSFAGLNVVSGQSTATYTPSCPTDTSLPLYTTLGYAANSDSNTAAQCQATCTGVCQGTFFYPDNGDGTQCFRLYATKAQATANRSPDDSIDTVDQSGFDCDASDIGQPVISWRFAARSTCAAGSNFISSTGACTACASGTKTNASGHGCVNVLNGSLAAGGARRTKRRQQRRRSLAMRSSSA